MTKELSEVTSVRPLGAYPEHWHMPSQQDFAKAKALRVSGIVATALCARSMASSSQRTV